MRSCRSEGGDTGHPTLRSPDLKGVTGPTPTLGHQSEGEGPISMACPSTLWRGVPWMAPPTWQSKVSIWSRKGSCFPDSCLRPPWNKHEGAARPLHKPHCPDGLTAPIGLSFTSRGAHAVGAHRWPHERVTSQVGLAPPAAAGPPRSLTEELIMLLQSPSPSGFRRGQRGHRLGSTRVSGRQPGDQIIPGRSVGAKPKS